LAAARRAGLDLVEVHRLTGVFLREHDILSLLALRLKELVPYGSLAVYRPQNDVLVAAFVVGENAALFSSLRIPVGEGLCGWVAQNHKAIVNGNPAVEPGYSNEGSQHVQLRSALAVPIEGASRLAAVLALYRTGQDAFTSDDLRLAEAIVSPLGATLESISGLKASGAGAGSK
jgi:GAF domain-containing protein